MLPTILISSSKSNYDYINTITITVDTGKMIAKVGGGGGICWRRWVEVMEASLEDRWLEDMLAAAGCVALVVSASFGGPGAKRSYYFSCLPNPRGGILCWWRRTLAEA